MSDPNETSEAEATPPELTPVVDVSDIETVVVDAKVCSSCDAVLVAGSAWCEACGADLGVSTDGGPEPEVAQESTIEWQPCTACGSGADEISDDGWCMVCGQKQPSPNDHVVDDHGWFAVVSDRGITHAHNEDAGAVAARDDGVALVVCDGVSSTDDSQHAARAAADLIAEALGQPATQPLPTLIAAATAAQGEVRALARSGQADPPSCTMVAAAAQVGDDEAVVTIGWLGDSRAYVIDADGTVDQLTFDHSWANEQQELGELDDEAIAADPRAHSITRWLGADSPDVVPELATHTFALPATLVLCSDGLWNYLDTNDAMAIKIRELRSEATQPVDLAEALVAFANEQGGRDNITVAIAELAIAPTTPPTTKTPATPATSPSEE